MKQKLNSANPSRTLTFKQQKAILALLSVQSHEMAAREAGVHSRTLSRWRHENPTFIAAYQEALQAKVSQERARMMTMLGPAVSTVARNMIDSRTSPATQVRSAEIFITQSEKMVEWELEARVAEVERSLKNLKKSRGKQSEPQDDGL